VNILLNLKSIKPNQWLFIILGNGVNINLSTVLFEILSLSWCLFFVSFSVLIWAMSYAEHKPTSKVKDEDLLAELHNINKSLNKISDCIDNNSRYGSAIKTTQATRY
jgi:hypothetical protein